MKPFKINRNSWHYKLNKYMNEDALTDNMMRRDWEPKVSNFCAYWRATVMRLVLFGLLASLGTVMLIALTFAVITAPGMVFFLFTLFAFVVLASYGVITLAERRKQVKMRQEKPQGLFAMKYRAIKDKICPNIEFD